MVELAKTKLTIMNASVCKDIMENDANTILMTASLKPVKTAELAKIY